MKYQNENFSGELDFRSGLHSDGYVMELHLHEYSEILYCKRGSGKVTVNGVAFILSEGEFIWLPPNYLHQYDFYDSEVVCAVFSNDLIPLFSKATAGKRPIVSAIKAGELSDIIGRLYMMKKENSLCLSGYLNLIAARALEHTGFDDTKYSDTQLYQKVITYISEHYTENITLSQISKTFGYNEKYLSHTLHELTGINFKRLLAYYRVNHAKRLLENDPSANITAVALESGFSAINTFHRSFRETTGMTPSEYRSSR